MTPQEFVAALTFADLLWYFGVWYVSGLIGWTILLFTDFDHDGTIDDCKFRRPTTIYLVDIFNIFLRSLTGPLFPLYVAGFWFIEGFAWFCGIVKKCIFWFGFHFWDALYRLYERSKSIKLFDFERKI